MAYATRTFDNPQELVDYLNDVIVGSPVGHGPFNLDGLKITIDGSEVTFSGTELRWPAVVAQINAVKAGAATLRNYGHQSPGNPRLTFTTPTHVLLGSGAGATANPLLGLPGADTTVGANAVALADVLTVFHLENQRVGVIHE
jgi:hypothetical protein